MFILLILVRANVTKIERNSITHNVNFVRQNRKRYDSRNHLYLSLSLVKILYIHQYFRTPDEGGSTRSYELAKGLVESGHEVTMITSHNQRRGLQIIDGIHVHYLPVRYKNEFGFLKRIFAFLRFVQLAKKEAKKITGVDLAYVMTTPLTAGLITLHLKRKLNIPYIFEVGDLWPEAPVQMNAIKNPWLIQKLYQFERKCYQEAKKVVALSPAIQAYIKKVTPEVETHIIPNLSDCTFFSQGSPKNSEILQIGYFGTFGKANDLSILIHLAEVCEERSLTISFTLMGEGAEEEQLKAQAKGLSNVRILPFGNKDQVKSEMVKMDAVYISYMNLPVLTTGSPNKLFDGLASGKLIVINFDGWIKTLIEKQSCGFSYSGDRPDEFIEKITPFISDSGLLRTYQKNSRNLAESEFEKKLLVDRFIQVITAN